MGRLRRVAPTSPVIEPGPDRPPVATGDAPRAASNPSALLVEADAHYAAHLVPVLEDGGFLVVRVETLKAAWAALCSGQRFSLVVVGMSLPDGEGLSLLPCIHAKLPGTRTPSPGVELLARPFDEARAEAAFGLRRPDC